MGIRELSPELAKVAKDELGEEPARIPADLLAIKVWLEKQTYIIARTDDQWLIAFLRGCKFSLERTKEKLDNYYSMKSFFPEINLAFNPMDAKMQALLNAGVSLILPKPCSPSGPRVLLLRPGCIDNKEYTILDCMLLNNMIIDMLLLDDDHTTVAGTHMIVDMKGSSLSFFSYFTQMSPATMKKLFTSSQDAVPVRQKGGHHINTPPGVETLFNLFKSFMNEKLQKRLFVHNQDMEALYKYVPKDIMPAEYGGNGGTLSEITEQTKARMERHRDFFLENINFKTDESKRPGKPRTLETSDSIEGSFRQLNVD